jgi:ATP/maltotriose-dependent transcriptional regulator MalT
MTYCFVKFEAGDFSKTKELAQEGLRLARQVNRADGTQWALEFLSLAAAVEGDHDQSQRYAAQITTDSFVAKRAALNSHAVHAYLMGDFVASRRYFCDFLEIAAARISAVLFVPAALQMQLAALLLCLDGKNERAVELLASACDTQIIFHRWLAHWPALAEAHAQLLVDLGAEAFSAAWERGREIDRVKAGRILLTEFAISQPNIASPNSELLPGNTLTDRELEVLRLLAEGLPNPDIAGRLFIAASTVKTHCEAIYSKLDVHNRTQAVARARELGLLP